MQAPVAVIFGDDYGHGISDDGTSMVLAKFKTGDKELGRIGVLGPTRMAYEQLIPSIEYFAERLGTLMTKALRDMED
jgi:heat-inducible transcriptional repressor